MLVGDKVKDIIVFIVDDKINIIHKDKVIVEKLSGVLSRGYVVNKEKFIETFLKILKKEKIKNKLFGDEITIVKNAYFTAGDLFFLETIFLEIGFIKVHFFDICELLPNEDATYIEINETYIVIYLTKGIYLSLDVFKDIPRIIEYFKNDFKENIILFGKNISIPKIKVNGLFLYYFDNYVDYISQSLLKVKKCDV